MWNRIPDDVRGQIIDLALEEGSVRRFVLGPFCQTLTNLSPKMTANCVFGLEPFPRRTFPRLGRMIENEI